MREVDRIADQLRRAFEQGAWHGPSVREVLQGVTPEQAMARPVPGAHSIWELVLHATTWIDVVRRRIEGERVGAVSPEQNFPIVSDTSDAAWERARQRLDETYGKIAATIRRLGDDRLQDRIIGAESDAAWTVYETLHGVIQHTLYHAGQMAILKKAFT